VHDYLLSTEVVRFAFMFGVAVSMLLYERRHITTGSIVVPGYIASFIVYPLIIVATFLNAFASYLIVNKLLSRWFLLYGRTKFTVLAMTSILIQTAMLKLTPSGPWLWESDLKLFVGVGYVVPALIAHDMGRQGIAKTTKSVLFAASIVAIPIALALAFELPGVNDLAPLKGVGAMAIDPAWIPVAVLLSAAASWRRPQLRLPQWRLRRRGVHRDAAGGPLAGRHRRRDRGCDLSDRVQVPDGFHDPVRSQKVLGNALDIEFDRLEPAVGRHGTVRSRRQKHLELGSLALTPLFVPGLIANDTQRTGPRRVLFGVVMATTFVLTSTWWIQSLFEELVLAPVWKFVSVASFAAIFWRQFVPSRSEARSDARADVAADATNAELAANALPGSATAYDQAAFERWGTVHREEAEAAERWLTVVADEQPKPAIAGDGGTPRLDRASGPEPEQRPTERIRRAAIQALNSPGELPSEQERQSDQEPAIAQLAADPRLASPEFDEIAADIAASVGRPHPLPRRRPAKPTTSTGSATPQEAGSLPGGDPTNQISEHPGAATRAHTIAAPGARTTQADTDREKGTTSTVFPE